jgi:hypothetical protein
MERQRAREREREREERESERERERERVQTGLWANSVGNWCSGKLEGDTALKRVNC